MKNIIRCILIWMIICGSTFVYAQEDAELSIYFDRACKFREEGDIASALSIYDSYLNEVQRTQGVDDIDYFAGVVFKSDVLIEAERFEEAEELLSLQ